VQRQITSIAALNKKSIDAALDAALVVAEGMERFGRLQVQAAKSLFRESADASRSLVGSRSLAEMTPAAGNAAAANIGRVVGYSRNAYDIASRTGVQLLELMNASTADLRKAWTGVAEGMSESMAMGTDGATNAALKSMMTASETMLDGLTRTARQSIELAEAAMKATASVASGAVKAPATGKD